MKSLNQMQKSKQISWLSTKLMQLDRQTENNPEQPQPTASPVPTTAVQVCLSHTGSLPVELEFIERDNDILWYDCKKIQVLTFWTSQENKTIEFMFTGINIF